MKRLLYVLFAAAIANGESGSDHERSLFAAPLAIVQAYGTTIEQLGHHALIGPHRLLLKGFGRLIQAKTFWDPDDAVEIESGFVGERSTGSCCITYSRGIGITSGEGREQALCFSRKLDNARIFYINATTKGFLSDLMTCVVEWFGFRTKACELMAEEVKLLYQGIKEQYGKASIHRVVYSKSAVDAWAYDKLLDPEIKQSIQTYSIAGFKMIRRKGYSSTINYINEADIIPILGGLELADDSFAITASYSKSGISGCLQNHQWESPGYQGIQQRIIQRLLRIEGETR